MSLRAAFWRGAREAIGVPTAVLAAGYIGFGALAGAKGASIWAISASTIFIWALPGQLVLMEMWQLAAPMIAVLLAVSLTNARFLPMTLTLLPVVRVDVHPRWRYYAAAHLVAMTSWAVCMRRCPDMPGPERLPFFAGFSLACIATSVIAGAAGFLVAAAIPPVIQVGLVFLNPVYFFVILVGDVQTRPAALALACGGLLGPVFHWVTPEWSVLASGFIGGTTAFFIHKALGAARG